MKQTIYLPDSLGGYSINRRPKYISFGCGEVKINISDLEALLIALPALKRIEKEIGYRVSISDILNVSTTQLKKIIGK